MNYLKIGARLSFCIIAFLLARQAAAKDTEFDVHETEHFILNFESTERIRNMISPEDAGKMLEALWAELDREIGIHCAVSDMKKEEMGITYPKCNAYLFDGMDSFTQAVQKIEGRLPTFNGRLANFYSKNKYSIYVTAFFHQYTKELLLHEATHYYCDIRLPGKFSYYPGFEESIAYYFSRYCWNGSQLFLTKDQKWFICDRIDFIKQLEDDLKMLCQSNPDEVFNLNFIGMNNLSTYGGQFTELERESEERLALYHILGSYLFQNRKDIIQDLIQKFSSSKLSKSPLTSRNAERTVHEIIQQVMEEKPILIADIHKWVQSIPVLCEIKHRKAEDGISVIKETENGFIVSDAIILMRFGDGCAVHPKIHVKFRPVNLSTHRIGIIINWLNRKNHDLLEVCEDDNIRIFSQKDGRWSDGSIVCHLTNESNSKPDQDYLWQVRRNGTNLDIYVNDQKAYVQHEPDKYFMGMNCIQGTFSIDFID